MGEHLLSMFVPLSYSLCLNATHSIIELLFRMNLCFRKLHINEVANWAKNLYLLIFKGLFVYQVMDGWLPASVSAVCVLGWWGAWKWTPYMFTPAALQSSCEVCRRGILLLGDIMGKGRALVLTRIWLSYYLWYLWNCSNFWRKQTFCLTSWELNFYRGL